VPFFLCCDLPGRVGLSACLYLSSSCEQRCRGLCKWGSRGTVCSGEEEWLGTACCVGARRGGIFLVWAALGRRPWRTGGLESIERGLGTRASFLSSWPGEDLHRSGRAVIVHEKDGAAAALLAALGRAWPPGCSAGPFIASCMEGQIDAMHAPLLVALAEPVRQGEPVEAFLTFLWGPGARWSWDLRRRALSGWESKGGGHV
jgi:hypothetical protein